MTETGVWTFAATGKFIHARFFYADVTYTRILFICLFVCVSFFVSEFMSLKPLRDIIVWFLN